MTQIIAQLSDTGTRYRALFCDLWGCVHDGIKALPGAVKALQDFRAQGGRVILVTNSPRPRASVERQILGMGVPRDAWDDIATSGDAAQYALLTGAVGQKVYHIGAVPKDEPFFTEFSEDLAELRATRPEIIRVPLEEAEGIVCTGLVDEFNDTPESYRAQMLYAKTNGLKLLCANPDIIVDVGERRAYCAGALAAYYDEMGGESLYFGKPWPPIYDLARRRLAAIDATIEDADILCVGDGILTDVTGGEQERLDTLFLTEGLEAGKFGPGPLPQAEPLEAFLREKGLSPTLAMGLLR